MAVLTRPALELSCGSNCDLGEGCSVQEEAEQVEELIRALRHVDGIDAVSDQERQM